MKKVAVIGGGIAGLSIANMLNKDFYVEVFEKEEQLGGMIKCKRIDGNLYHLIGGHVFNSHCGEVLDWFWNIFDKENEFIKATRRASIVLKNNAVIDYPIENHIYQLDKSNICNIVNDLLAINRNEMPTSGNFADFLKNQFGETLYGLYFKPYNEKIWRRDLSTIPLIWLKGKLPMPTVSEIFFNNFCREEEKRMVHSSFYYPKNNGSQFIVDKLSKSLNCRTNHCVTELIYYPLSQKWIINNSFEFDYIVFTGNIKTLPNILPDFKDYSPQFQNVECLQSHGTTSVLCRIDKNPYSWIYLPDLEYLSHRIICTGNFAPSNNNNGDNSAIVEFSDFIEKEMILDNLKRMPFNPQYISHQYSEYSYPIHNDKTKDIITKIKNTMASLGLFMLGRFAEWEYYNMDAIMSAAIKLKNERFDDLR